jgi:uncharacterized membrane protein YeaQ/YmgE (transglycosylase-associated protein family)
MNATSAAGVAAGTLGLTFGLFLVLAAVSGLIIGALARWVLPGPDPMSTLHTMGYGLAGGFLGGLVGGLLGLQARGLPGLLIAVACAALLIWYFRRRKPR